MQLIVLVHGMWGKARDFDYLVEALVAKGYVEYDALLQGRAKDDGARGVVYCARSNEGYFTYDGIDICGLRIANEITEAVSALRGADHKIHELSIVGYSMGGLMVRYAIGLLYERRLFDDIKPHVLVTTCTPHVGVNVLGGSKGARLFNTVGSWSMARTSRQAFLRDSDRPQGQPLFLYLTQPNTACTRALALFPRRVLYANIANDHRCEYYTSAVESKDPYKPHDLRLLSGVYVPSYEPVVVHGAQRPTFESLEDSRAATPGGDAAERPPPRRGVLGALCAVRAWAVRKLVRFLRLGALAVRIGVVAPVWFLAFLLNASYQRTASSLRTRSTLRTGSHALADGPDLLEASAEGIVEDAYRTVQDEGLPQAETIPLTPLMNRIVTQFNELGWEKYLLRIIATPKAHSAAIMKLHWRQDFYEGKLAIQHLVTILLDEKTAT